jgi:hypothetical protein
MRAHPSIAHSKCTEKSGVKPEFDDKMSSIQFRVTQTRSVGVMEREHLTGHACQNRRDNGTRDIISPIMQLSTENTYRETCLFIFDAHVRSRKSHRLDSFVKRDTVNAVACHRKLGGCDSLDGCSCQTRGKT